MNYNTLVPNGGTGGNVEASPCRRKSQSGQMMLIVLGAALVLGISVAAMFSYLPQMTRERGGSNEFLAVKSLLNSSIRFMVYAVQNQWVIDPVTGTNDIAKQASFAANPVDEYTYYYNLERFLLQPEALKTKINPMLLGCAPLPGSQCALNSASYKKALLPDPLESTWELKLYKATLSAQNPLKLMFTSLGAQSMQGIDYTISQLSSNPNFPTGARGCRFLRIRATVITDQNAILRFLTRQSNLWAEADVGFCPDELNRYALITADSLFLDKPTTTDGTRNDLPPGGVGISTAQNNAGWAGINFKSPVYVYDSVYIPQRPQKGVNNWNFSFTTFSDVLVLGKGEIWAPPDAGGEPEIFHPSSASGQYADMTDRMGGFLKGVARRSNADEGLRYLFNLATGTITSTQVGICADRNRVLNDLPFTSDSVLVAQQSTAVSRTLASPDVVSGAQSGTSTYDFALALTMGKDPRTGKQTASGNFFAPQQSGDFTAQVNCEDGNGIKFQNNTPCSITNGVDGTKNPPAPLTQPVLHAEVKFVRFDNTKSGPVYSVSNSKALAAATNVNADMSKSAVVTVGVPPPPPPDSAVLDKAALDVQRLADAINADLALMNNPSDGKQENIAATVTTYTAQLVSAAASCNSDAICNPPPTPTPVPSPTSGAESSPNWSPGNIAQALIDAIEPSAEAHSIHTDVVNGRRDSKDGDDSRDSEKGESKGQNKGESKDNDNNDGNLPVDFTPPDNSVALGKAITKIVNDAIAANGGPTDGGHPSHNDTAITCVTGSSLCQTWKNAAVQLWVAVHLKALYAAQDEALARQKILLKAKFFSEHPFEIGLTTNPYADPGTSVVQQDRLNFQTAGKNWETLQYQGYIPVVTVTAFEVGSDGNGRTARTSASGSCNFATNPYCNPQMTSNFAVFQYRYDGNGLTLDVPATFQAPGNWHALNYKDYASDQWGDPGSLGTAPTGDTASPDALCDNGNLATSYHQDMAPSSRFAWNFRPPPTSQITFDATNSLWDTAIGIDTAASAAHDPTLYWKWPVYSIVPKCVIKSDAKLVTGFYVCDELAIEDRDSELRIIGTFIVGKVKISQTAIASGIVWSSVHHPDAINELWTSWQLGHGLDCKTLFNNYTHLMNQPVFHPELTLDNEGQRRACFTPALLGAYPANFRWTTVSPVCSIPQQNAPNTDCTYRDDNYSAILFDLRDNLL